MKLRFALIIFLGVLLLLGCAAVSFAGKDGNGESEEQITLDQCPPAVQETIKIQAAGGVVKEIEKEIKDGKTVYEAEILKDGKTIEIKVAEDGTLIKSEVDDDEENEAEEENENDDD